MVEEFYYFLKWISLFLQLVNRYIVQSALVYKGCGCNEVW